ncbi:MAG: lauroyl acyltransferase [Thermodesulfobacteriota bacterium]
MRAVFYRLLALLSAVLGDWLFILVARGIAAGYFLLFPRRVGVGLRFYRALFPGRSVYYHLWCTFRQFQQFTTVFWDRCLVRTTDAISFTSEGHDHIEAAMRDKTGGIILMSHLGNWDVAAHLLQRQWQDMRLLMYMGIRDKEEIERLQKQNLAESGIRILAVDTAQGSPLDILEGVRFIREGGLVLQTGDIIWKPEQRSVPARFLGHPIRLPMAPFTLAQVSGAPLFIFFAFRLDARKYHFVLSPPMFLKTTARAEREAAIQRAAQQYADTLEQALRRHPFEWYHFEPFLENNGTDG